MTAYVEAAASAQTAGDIADARKCKDFRAISAARRRAWRADLRASELIFLDILRVCNKKVSF